MKTRNVSAVREVAATQNEQLETESFKTISLSLVNQECTRPFRRSRRCHERATEVPVELDPTKNLIPRRMYLEEGSKESKQGTKC